MIRASEPDAVPLNIPLVEAWAADADLIGCELRRPGWRTARGGSRPGVTWKVVEAGDALRPRFVPP